MENPCLYRVSFINQDKVFEIYACSVGSAAMPGFIEISEIRFGEKSSIVVDPSEEGLRNEFKGVKRTYIPVHNVIRIDEVEKIGRMRVTPAGKTPKVRPFPVPASGREERPDDSS